MDDKEEKKGEEGKVQMMGVTYKVLHMGRKKTGTGLKKKYKIQEKLKKKALEEKLRILEKAEPDFVAHLRLEEKVQKLINEVPPESEEEGEGMGSDLEEEPIPDLQEWDHMSLPENFFLVLEGKRRTGKTTFAKWLLQFYKHRFQLVWVMTRTRASGFWQKIVGSDYTFTDYNPAAIARIVQRNDKIIEKYGPDSPITKLKASTLIILDDVISAKIHDDPTFTMMAAEGRHHKLSIILMTQDPKAIGPKVRDNTDVAIVFNQKTFRNKESIWHDFANDADKDTALGLMEKYAVAHDALACVQTNLNSDIHRNYYKITGDKTILQDPEYILGGAGQQNRIRKEQEAKAAAKPIKEMMELDELKRLKATGVMYDLNQDPEKLTVADTKRSYYT
jgi:hypothetical protein